MKTPNGGPAFPYAFHFPDIDGEPEGINLGMTLRDYFAAAALQGLLACPDTSGVHASFAKNAYEHADAMLAARAKGGAS